MRGAAQTQNEIPSRRGLANVRLGDYRTVRRFGLGSGGPPSEDRRVSVSGFLGLPHIARDGMKLIQHARGDVDL